MPTLISPASRSRIRVAQIVESTARGETPATGAYKILPHLDNTVLNQTQTFERSNQVKSNRQGGLQVGGNIESGGTLAVPLKEDPGVIELFESMMSETAVQLGVTGAVPTGSDFAYVDGATMNDSIIDNNSVYDFIASGWQVGDQIATTTSTTPANDITTAVQIRILVVNQFSIEFATGTVDTAEVFAAGTTLDSQSNTIIAGVTRKFFTHEVTYTDLSPVTYEYFRGMEVNTATITVPTAGEVSAEFAMVGLVGKISETEWDRSNNYSGTLTPGTNTRTAESGNVPYAGSVAGSQLDRGGTIAPEVESLTININNNRAVRFAVGQQSGAFVEEGDFDAELTFALYFRDKTVLEQYLAGTRTSLIVTVQDQQTSHQLTMNFPNIVFTAGDKAINGQAVVQNMTAFAEEDATGTSPTGTKMIASFQELLTV